MVSAMGGATSSVDSVFQKMRKQVAAAIVSNSETKSCREVKCSDADCQSCALIIATNELANIRPALTV
ncbi:hypothetical protein GCM10011396_45810 [Undibacterium terreum]|uniref:Uncharacterized protein n=1 Tax=Undibacterium terreum TaxID=1224302 RepID=A0A916UZP4_9BURK|nr:hypothetical protein GCM10011396_45810 [Undibacterium terreum]